VKWIGFLIGLAGCLAGAQAVKQGDAYVVSPVDVVRADASRAAEPLVVSRLGDGAAESVLLRYSLADLPERNPAVASMVCKVEGRGTGKNPALALYVVKNNWSGTAVPEKIRRISEATLRPDRTDVFSFQIRQEDWSGDEISLLMEMRSPPGFSQPVTLLDSPKLYLAGQSDPEFRQELLVPVWSGSQIINETLLPTSYDGKPAEACLAFAPSRIVSVRNYRLDQLYQDHRDYEVDGRTLRLTDGSSIPFLRYEELYHKDPSAKPGAMKMRDGGWLTFSESSFFNDRQLAVTYEHNEPWAGPVPASAQKFLPRTFQALQNGGSLKLVVFGDSISNGSNASGKSLRAPFLPRWADLVAERLRQVYPVKLDYINPSLGGMTSRWGRETVDGLVSFEKPDLVIIGFGMNDGGGVSTDEFIENTRAMMDSIRGGNPQAEFILLMSMQPNSRWRNLDPMPEYLQALRRLQGPGVAVADVWSIHEYLLQHKTYWDMTGNHVNHPNDFMVRIYAQTLLAVLGVE
jgi:hypothetical protein